MIIEQKGNLLDTNCQYICHQVNCCGKMNSGVAKAIREKWPVVFEEYKKWYDRLCEMAANEYGGHEEGLTGGDIMLGKCLGVVVGNDQCVINMASQRYYGYDGLRYTSYDSFWECLEKIKSTIPKGSSIAFPHGIGCVRGGANWEVIRTMISEVLADEYDVYIYKLEETK